MTEINRFPLALSSWDEKEIEAIQSVIKTDHYTMNGKVEKFEELFAKKMGSKYAVMVNSGSSANLLAINALVYRKDQPLVQGDEIIVPSLSWSTMYYPVHQCGMKLVFVDIDKETLNIDINQLESALSKKTRAIFIPNILGNPANLNQLLLFCKKHGLYLIEDNCESMGAYLNDKATGTYGICGTFSTFFSHHISTMEGGLVITDDEELYHIMLCMRSHGWTRHLPETNKLCKKSKNDFYESFRFILPGYNIRPVEMSGAIGIEQLKKLDHFIEIRRKNAEYFFELFGEDKRFILQKENGSSSWFGFSFLINKCETDIERSDLIKLLIKNNVEVRPIVSGNFLKNDVIKHLNHRVVGEHSNSNYVHDYGFFIGNHHVSLVKYLDYLKRVLT